MKPWNSLRAALVRAWCARALLAHSNTLNVETDDIAQLLRFLTGLEPAGDWKARLPAIAATARAGERALLAAPMMSEIRRAFGWSRQDLLVLAFACELHWSRDLSRIDCLYSGKQGSRQRLIAALTDCIGIPAAHLRRTLTYNSSLRRSGLVGFDFGYRGELMDVVEPSQLLLDQWTETEPTAVALMQRFFQREAGAHLSLADYGHLAETIERMCHHLKSVRRTRARGVNVLLYGPPGTGKTELARVLAAAVGAILYSVPTEDAEGQPIDAVQRLEALRAAQRALGAGRRSLLLMDEAEDVFRRGQRERDASVSHKGWINRQLEDNVHPCIWTTNRIDVMDASQLRRFDMVVELGTPPRSSRRQMAERYLAPLQVDATLLAVIADRRELTPAHLARAARVVASQPLARRTPSARAAIDELLQANGEPRLQPQSSPFRFDPLLVTTDDPQALRLDSAGPPLRICLHGPPGTGKSAYARHLAERLDVPLLEYRCSDLLSPWVGATEARIAEMFRHAEQERGLLMLDEADSFLGAREAGMRSWELTQANEFLVALERYDGWLVASTNRLEALDPAALRRFDLKLRFAPASLPTRLALFQRQVDAHGLRADLSSAELRSGLARLDQLTPGDYAALERRLQRLPEDARLASRLLLWLGEEHALKPGARRGPFGFAA